MNFFLFLIASALGSVLAIPTRRFTPGQTLHTTSGFVQGHAAPNANDVSEYIGIPYAKAPVGDLRWAAPEAFTSNNTLDATKHGNSCPTNGGFPVSADAAFRSLHVTEQGIQVIDGLLAQREDTFSEDCLFLNVWSKPQTGEAKKAVMVFIHGGGFTGGSSRSVGYSGQHMADESDIIVVSMNYRLAIFGFPGAPNARNNLALLDQRLAVEWVRDNIAAFGGDPSRITIFGQSAGGSSVDFYSFAWTDDPIVAGFIPESGIAKGPATAETSASAWFNVTSTLGCGNASSLNQTAVLFCMRSKDYPEVMKAMALGSGSGIAAITGQFGPTVDNTVVFADYDALGREGKFIHKPLLIGNNENEAGLFVPILEMQGYNYSTLFYDTAELLLYTCPTASRGFYSAINNVPTWRYRYFGTFPDETLMENPASGAWHGSELPLILGTDLDLQDVMERTSEQENMATYMRGAWTSFAKDPENGLTSYGLPRYEPLGATLLRFGYNNETGPNAAFPLEYDALCPGIDLLYDLVTGTPS